MRVRFGESGSSQDNRVGERDVMAEVVPGVGAMYGSMITLVIAGTAPLNGSATREVLFLG